jgi:hypothetical protein
VAGSCELGDEPSVSGTMELIIIFSQLSGMQIILKTRRINYVNVCMFVLTIKPFFDLTDMNPRD